MKIYENDVSRDFWHFLESTAIEQDIFNVNL